MLINTKYFIGYQFWLPRVYEREEREDIIINGKIYTRKYIVLYPTAKHKIITGIKIDVDNSRNKEITYKINDFGKQNIDFPQSMNKDTFEIMFQTQKEAMNYAIDRLNDKKEVFYGEYRDGWEDGKCV